MATTKKTDEVASEATVPATDEKVTIRIPKVVGGDNSDVFVSVNERTWQIKRGVEVTVPRCVAETIETSEKQKEQYLELIEKRSR